MTNCAKREVFIIVLIFHVPKLVLVFMSKVVSLLCMVRLIFVSVSVISVTSGLFFAHALNIALRDVLI